MAESPLVIFHSMNGTMHCDDGFASACVAKLGLAHCKPEPEFFPGIYGQEPPLDKVEGRHVYLLDFSYKRPVMLEIGRRAACLTVLDHHKTAEAELAGLADELMADGWPMDGQGQYLNCPYVRFDMEHSGAILAWQFFFSSGFGPPPDLLLRVEDGDLWRFAYPDTKLVQAALRSYPQTFEVWAELMKRPIAELAEEGKAVRRFIERKVEELLPNARDCALPGHPTTNLPLVNCPAFLASEVAGVLAERSEEGWACAYYDTTTHRVFSLRSRGEDAPDVSEIAKACGGGGHRNAAGFQVLLGGL